MDTFISDAIIPQDRFIACDSDDPDDWKYWATLITGTWQSSVANIIETGKQLNEAKDKLTRDEFNDLIKKFLPFKKRTAERLMKLAHNPILSDATHVSRLPAHWGTLVALDTLALPPAELTALINTSKINARMERSEVAKLKPKTGAVVPRKSAIADLKQANIEQARRILDLESDLEHAKRNDGSLFGRGDPDKLIARILVETLGEDKARKVARAVLAGDWKKEKKESAPIGVNE